MSEAKNNILYLFVRPGEPVFLPKGKERVVFDTPEKYWLDTPKPVAEKVVEKFDDENNRKVKIDDIDCTDCGSAMNLGRDDQFSVFIPEHRKMAGKLIDVFMSKKTCDEFLSVASYCRDRVNSNMFIYALSVALLHRNDTKSLSIPSLAGTFPHLFVNSSVIKRAKEEVHLLSAKDRRVIEVPIKETATNLDIEHRVAYFREDLGVNLHHNHWHLVYPDSGCREVIDKDRRGELFYYMHQQINARYNFERLSNCLLLVKSLSNLREPIPEGYFSKLSPASSAKSYPGRHSGAMLKDVDRSDLGEIDLQDLERQRDRILNAIHRGTVITEDGKKVELTECDGIDILGNLVCATDLSVNKTFYGDLHNNGHIAISICHDPDNRHLEGLGVMGDNATALRDPIFYRWHAFVDNIFQAHKNLLPPYTKKQLDYKGLEIENVEILCGTEPVDSFQTRWQRSEVDISGGLDFHPGGPVRVGFTHLNYDLFAYKITVNNNCNKEKLGTVRIFMAPKLDESGKQFALDKQRKLMIEMDKFTVTIPSGRGTVFDRKSTESSVTIPFEQTFPKIKQTDKISEKTKEEAYCGCGWPQHMLIPKGTADGFPVDLFVMVSNYDWDKVDQGPGSCCTVNTASYCGLKDKKYPDARAMGYPFDRPVPMKPGASPYTIHNFICAHENMYLKEMEIVFNDKNPAKE